MKNLILLSLSCFLISCSNNDKIIVGEWRRINDPAGGMTIEITDESDRLIGTLTNVPEFASSYGFSVGDIKWKEIDKISDNKYQFKDLYKEMNFNSKQIIQMRYDDFYLIISENRDTLKTRAFAKGNEDYGTSQIWIRIE